MDGEENNGEALRWTMLLSQLQEVTRHPSAFYPARRFPLGVPGVQNFVWADCFQVGHYATSEWMSEVNYVFPSNYIL